MGEHLRMGDIWDYLYPPRCPACDGISAYGICDRCRRDLVYIRDDFCMKCGKPLAGEQDEYCADCGKKRHYFDQGRALFSYQGRIRPSLYRLKYANRREYAAVYGREMADSLGGWVRQMRITKIVPIPLHPSRQRKRGYNQADLLAKVIGRCLDLPVDTQLLCRVRKTAPQKTLTSRQRKENLAGAFQTRSAIRPGERILLVDDIYTTGNTADAAALCLKRSGTCRVYVMNTAIGG
ncbi:MAG: ComF family protein [Clostridiales bacterium]|nr:ComF family protein [Clostridiales bacterium]